MTRQTLVLFFIFLFQGALAQESVGPLGYNPFLKNIPSRAGKTLHGMQTLSLNDTLQLPFMDDFSTVKLIPDTNLWTDCSVYINNNFPIDPPSFNVATFDALDRYGNPYNITGVDPYGLADTLSSKPIDLSGTDTTIFLSFFIEPQGMGLDSLQNRDSLYLDFYNQFGTWERVWRICTKGNNSVFKQYLVPVRDLKFLHPGFRFRFMNRTGLAGNLNHVHLDYIRLDRARSVNDTLSKDICINGYPKSLLKNYRALPWKQFKNLPNLQNEIIDSIYIRTRNLDAGAVQALHGYKAVDYGFNLIKMDSNRLNLKAYDTVLYRLPKFSVPVSTPEDSFFMIRMKYFVNTTFDLNLNNDTLEQLQPFSNYIAYDDGSAEAGYMLSGQGKVAVHFQLQKADTLKAIQVFFNQSEFDTENKPCSLAVWSKIGNNETIRYIKVLSKPVYTDMVNGFATIVLDTPQFIDPLIYTNLEFYIGWIQSTAYAVNIGLDVHYDQLIPATAISNPNLNYNAFGVWSKSLYRAIPMIRPVLGSSANDPLTVKPVQGITRDDIKIYPNPVNKVLKVEVSKEGSYQFTVIDFAGRLHTDFEGGNQEEIPCISLKPGIYFLRVTDLENKSSSFVKFIKQ